MEDFKWCVWLSPPDGHAWHGFIMNVPAHVSIAVYLDNEAEASALADQVVERAITACWTGPLVQTCTNGFYALTRDMHVLPTSATPDWWPADAHVSFAYKYGAPFSQREIDGVVQKLALRHHEVELNVCRIAKATGHYSSWKYKNIAPKRLAT